MCGILGGNNKKWNYEKAIKLLNHRGPDNMKIVDAESCILGFTRLAIIDLTEAAMQPMISEDECFYMVFNGEIYDYKELRQKLENKGHIFKTQSDTEVILKAFIEWKEEMVEHFDGIFSIGILDKKEQKLYLFRDRAGVKPLFYFYKNKYFAFASELKAIEALCDDESLEIDKTAIYDFYNYLYIPYPKTKYKNVYKLEPAHCLIFSLKNNKIIKKYRYWDLNVNCYEGNTVTEEKMQEKAFELRYLMEQAVKKQLISDVPIGTFFSGGVDSSIISFQAKQIKKEILSFSIAFTDKKYDESKYIKQIGKYTGLDYQIKYFSQDKFQILRRKLVNAFDEPFGDLSLYPTYFVSEFAKQNVTVVLSGDGGDELFGGYNRYLKEKQIVTNRGQNREETCIGALIREKTTKLRRIINTIDDVDNLIPYYLYSQKFSRARLRHKYQIPIDYDDGWFYRKFYRDDLPFITRMRYMDFMTYLPCDILTKVDMMSMKSSLEARVPFLDKNLIEFAFSLTQNECNPNGKLKGLLLKAYSYEIPSNLFDRPKFGFMLPHRYISMDGNITELIAKECEV